MGRRLVVALILCALAVPARGATQEKLGLHVRPCTQGRTKHAALCGTFGVYENRESNAGRIIELRLVVLKAPHPNGKAIAYIEGGPGQAAVPDAPDIADGQDPMTASFRDRYDIVFVDNRGMGASNPTNCNIAPYGDMSSYFSQIWPDEILRSCYRRSTATSDLNFYNTENAVDDLSDVLAALGYSKTVLIGGSYGTFFALVYVRRHPQHVESAVLEAVAAPGFQPLPGSPDGAQRALDDLAAKCGSNAPCRRHFPHFTDEFRAVLARMDSGPISIRVLDPKAKRYVYVKLSKEVFVDRIREGLYFPAVAAFLPYMIDRAYRNDYVPLGREIDAWSQLLNYAQDAGTNLSYRCADFDPFISESALRAAAAHSFASDLRVRAERRACAIWKVNPMPPSFNDPVRSDVPVLMISGSDDPATPAKYGTQALRYLPNGKQILVYGAGHGAQNDCTVRLAREFVTAASARAVQTSICRGSFTLPAFATSMAGWNAD
jgi:pimeloyl-ACP methyl ester carboxylesterase